MIVVTDIVVGSVAYYSNIEVMSKHENMNPATVRNKFSRTGKDYVISGTKLIRKQEIISK